MSTARAITESAFDLESQVRSYCRRFPVTFTTASGSTMTDDTGRTYLDFLAGCSALNYGHNEPTMQRALVDYLTGNGIAHALDLQTEAKARFLDSFRRLVLEPAGLDHRVQFTGPTGANAVEAAIKLARKVTGRANVLSFTHGYHGVSLGALALTGTRGHRTQPGFPMIGAQRAMYDGYLGPDVDTAAVLDRLLSDPSSGYDPPAAFILETVQGEGGLNAASPEWLRSVAEIARRHGALLIVDDIQAGCGRTGPFLSFTQFGIVPDLVTLSKSISGFGLPMALVLIRPELDRWEPAEHNGTFRGNNLAFVTAATALETFWSDPGLRIDIDRRGELVAEGLRAIAAESFPNAHLVGRGMFRGLDTGSGLIAAAICRGAFERGVILETSGAHDEVVKILAPLTTPDDQLLDGLDRIADSAREVASRVSELEAIA